MSDPSIVTQAATLARHAHWGQHDKAGVPYIMHPARVADSVVTRSYECRAAAWLHDVVEDTPITVRMIAEEFGARVAELVDLMSQRDGETYKDYVRRIAASKDADAIALKLADLADNSNMARLAGIKDAKLKERMTKMIQTRYAWARTELVRARDGGARDV